jgi:hypothetical protein
VRNRDVSLEPPRMGSRRVLIQDPTSPSFPPEGIALISWVFRGIISCVDPAGSDLILKQAGCGVNFKLRPQNDNRLKGYTSEISPQFE